MGWTSTYRRQGTSHLAFFRGEFDDAKFRALDAAAVGYTEVYLAVGFWHNGYQEGTEPDEVVGFVSLTKWAPNDPVFNFTFKIMSETEGPWCHNCPERILKQLTPTNNEYALKWREQCWENIRRRKARPRLKVGDAVLFSRDLAFTNGAKLRIAEVIEDGRRLRFAPYPAYPASRRRPYRIRREDVYGAITISSPNPRQGCNPSSFLQALTDEWGPKAVGQAHTLVERLGFVVPYALRDPEQAAENLAELLRFTLEMIDHAGSDQVETVYSTANLIASGIKWGDLSDADVVQEIVEQITLRMPDPAPNAVPEPEPLPDAAATEADSPPKRDLSDGWSPPPVPADVEQLSLFSL